MRYCFKTEISCLVLHLLLKHPNEEHLIRDLKKFDGNPFENVAGGNVKFYAKEQAQEISLSALPSSLVIALFRFLAESLAPKSDITAFECVLTAVRCLY